MGIYLSRGPTASEAKGEDEETSNLVPSVKETSVQENQTCPPKESKPSPSRSPKRKGVTFGPTSTVMLESEESPPASSSYVLNFLDGTSKMETAIYAKALKMFSTV